MNRAEEIRAFISELYAKSEQDGKRKAALAFVDLWTMLQNDGVDAWDFAHAALPVISSVVTLYETPDRNLVFGQRLKEEGSSKIRCASNHWPPVDSADWPEDWPKGQINEDL